MGTGPLTSVLDTLFRDLKTGVKEKRSSLEDRWSEIVGSAFARHTKGVIRTGKILAVWVDDSALASELAQKYQGTILKNAQTVLGEETVQKIVFRVGETR